MKVMAKNRGTENILKVAFFVLLVIMVIMVIIRYYPPKGDASSAYNATLERIAGLDQEHNMRFKDYYYGLEELRYKPRYPKPLNAGDIPAVVEEFEDIRDDVKGDRPSSLVVDMRINLLQAEMYYKLSKKYPLKGSVEDGFNCKERPAIIEAVGNLNESVRYGRLAIENMKELLDNHPEEAGIVDISKYRYTSINETFDDLADKAKKNENTINYFCLEDQEYDEEIEDEFLQAKEMMKGSQPAVTG